MDVRQEGRWGNHWTQVNALIRRKDDVVIGARSLLSNFVLSICPLLATWNLQMAKLGRSVSLLCLPPIRSEAGAACRDFISQITNCSPFLVSVLRLAYTMLLICANDDTYRIIEFYYISISTRIYPYLNTPRTLCSVAEVHNLSLLHLLPHHTQVHPMNGRQDQNRICQSPIGLCRTPDN